MGYPRISWAAQGRRFGLTLAGLVGGWTALLEAQWVRPTAAELTGVFAAGNLTESSGVAVSRALPGILWTHNDSGDRPILYATNLAGEDLGAFRIAGAQAVDWEDIALGLCPEADTTCLYIADTGDNTESRKHAAIYIVREPQRPPVRGRRPLDSLLARRLRVRYADGPQDVEALAVTHDGELLLITKGRARLIKTYRISRNAARLDTVTVELSGVLDTLPPRALGRQVTGAAISPSGRRLVIRAYLELRFFRLPEEGPPVPEGAPCFLGVLREPQGEAVDFLDERTLVLTSEAGFGRPGGIAAVRCPISETQDARR